MSNKHRLILHWNVKIKLIIIISGAEGGVMFHLEDRFGKKCFWALCLLHIGELFPRRLLEELDGKTTGPNKYGGPIGRLLDTVSERPIIPDFAKVDRWPGPEIPREIRDEMCEDQQYFLRLCDIVRTGEVLHCKGIIKTSIFS